MNVTAWAERRRLRREMWVWRIIAALSFAGMLGSASVEWWPVVVFNAASVFVCLRFHRETREQLDSWRWSSGGMDQ